MSRGGGKLPAFFSHLLALNSAALNFQQRKLQMCVLTQCICGNKVYASQAKYQTWQIAYLLQASPRASSRLPGKNWGCGWPGNFAWISISVLWDQFDSRSSFNSPYLLPNSSPNLIPARASSPKSSGRRGWIPDLVVFTFSTTRTPPIIFIEYCQPWGLGQKKVIVIHRLGGIWERVVQFQVNWIQIFHLDNRRRRSQHHCWQCRLGRLVAAMSQRVHRVEQPEGPMLKLMLGVNSIWIMLQRYMGK